MTITARKVLSDCSHVHELLELEENERNFRLLWVSCSSLLRTVGHVLHKVDCERSEAIKRSNDIWWTNINQNKEENAIFFEFIEKERNNILKEYELGFFSGEINVLISATGEEFTLAETAFCPMSHGVFEGKDCRDVAKMAIEWWKLQLNAIDAHTHPE